MELITRQKNANKAYSKWMRRYKDDRNGVGARLKNLGDSPNPDNVDNIIGNTSWTDTPSCSECDAHGVPVVEIGEYPDYHSSTAWVCLSCLEEAVKLAKEGLNG